MIKTLHITNGDSTRISLEKSGLEGEISVCRELFCEGEIIKDVGSDEFWMQRYEFFKTTYGVDKLSYFDKSIKEFVKFEDVSRYQEVVLWFEYDLFCQVNLMAVCTFLLNNYKSAVRYYLICVGREHPKDIWKTLADYQPDEYISLYKNKTKLSRHDLLFIKDSWEVYVRNDEKELRDFNFKKNKKIKYFDIAMRQHLKRFKNDQGFDEIDKKILEIINEKPLSENEIVKELLQWQRKETVYGFGDSQYFRKLKSLNEFYQVKENVFYLK